jgi:hypothetical protein
MREFPLRMGVSRILLVMAVVIIILGVTVFYLIAQPSSQSSRTISIQAASSTKSSASPQTSGGLLRIEEAQLVIIPGGSCCPPGNGVNSFIVVLRNLGNQSISKLQVELGNETTIPSAPTILPGHVYIGNTSPPLYSVCSYQPMTISGILANQTSFTLRDKVLVTGTQSQTCSDEPLLLSMNQFIVPVNATDLSDLPGNATWSFVASNTNNQSVKMAYVTLTLIPPTNPPNDSGYESATVDLGALPPGRNVSNVMSFSHNSNCLCETIFHVTLLNGTSLDFTTSPQIVEQSYFKTFVISRPGSGVLSAQYVSSNVTSSVNVTSRISVASLSASGSSQGIIVTANPAVVSTKPGYVTPIALQIQVTAAAADGAYLITYPLDICPGIVLIVGSQPSSIPPIPAQSNCLGGFPSGQVQAVSGIDTVYLPQASEG